MKTARELINQTLPPLKPTDTVKKALDWMGRFHISQLPVVNGSDYLGLVDEPDLLNMENGDIKISELELKGSSVFVDDNDHFFHVLKTAVENKVEHVAVLDHEKKYVGIITVNDTVFSFAQLCAFSGPGSTIILRMEERDYSLSEISRLIELNNAKIVSSFITNSQHDPTVLSLTLKINKTDAASVIATLERHGYQITAKYDEEDSGASEKDNFDQFMKYLDI